MLTKRFYLVAIFFSFLALFIIATIALYLEPHHSNGNGYHLAILQTVISLCTLTSVFAALRNEIKNSFRQKIFSNVLDDLMEEISISGEIPTSDFRQNLIRDIRKKLDNTLNRLVKCIVYSSVLAILLALIAINCDCLSCDLFYMSWLLFLPTIFLCVSFLIFKYISKEKIVHIVKYNMPDELKSLLTLTSSQIRVQAEEERAKFRNLIPPIQVHVLLNNFISK